MTHDELEFLLPVPVSKEKAMELAAEQYGFCPDIVDQEQDVYKRQEQWNILVGRQPLQNIGLRTDDGWDISGEDVQIWREEQGENSFAISAYCEKLLPMLREEEGRAWWMPVSYTHLLLLPGRGLDLGVRETVCEI